MKAIKILERVLYTIPIMFGVAVIVFVFIRMTPGDPVDIMMGQGGAISAGEIEQLRSEFHLDEPITTQLWYFLRDAVQGDLGYSYIKKQPVTTLIGDRLPATIELATAALLFALLVAFPIGIISAVRQNSLLIFAVWLHWLPVQGRIDPNIDLDTITGFYIIDSIITGNWAALWSCLGHLVLPAVTLGAAVAAIVARVLRSSMLETLRSDYVQLARAKGASEGLVVSKHALRNALIPTVTVVGLQVGVLLGGNMIVETVFGWPGLGRMVVEAIFNRDFPLVQGAVMIYAFTFVMANLIVDVMYTYLNPKITL
jgi:ABC-type dipeptide/oligopeptide/nickel transport system permease component